MSSTSAARRPATRILARSASLFRVMVMDFCLVKMTGYGIKRAPFWQLNHTNAVFDAPGACGLERLRVWRPNPLWSKNNE